MIRDFDERYFKYGDEVMTYSPDEQHNPYIDENGNEYFEYSFVISLNLNWNSFILSNMSCCLIIIDFVISFSSSVMFNWYCR